jgi:hypothetical protein
MALGLGFGLSLSSRVGGALSADHIWLQSVVDAQLPALSSQLRTNLRRSTYRRDRKEAIKAAAGLPSNQEVGIPSGIIPGVVEPSTPASPITINSEANAISAADSGTGTASDPYVIRNREFDGAGSSVRGIWFNDPDADYYVHVTDCILYDFTSECIRIGSPNVIISQSTLYNTVLNGELVRMEGYSFTMLSMVLSGCDSFTAFIEGGSIPGPFTVTLRNILITDNDGSWATNGDVFSIRNENILLDAKWIETETGMTGAESVFMITDCAAGSKIENLKVNGGWEHAITDNDNTANSKSFDVRYFDIRNTSEEAIYMQNYADSVIEYGYVEHTTAGTDFRLIHLASDSVDNTIRVQDIDVKNVRFNKTTGTNIATNECLESFRGKNIRFMDCYVMECTEDAFEHAFPISGCTIERCVGENVAGQVADIFKQWDEATWAIVDSAFGSENAIDTNCYVHDLYGDCGSYALIISATRGVVFHDIYVDNTASVNQDLVRVEDRDSILGRRIWGAGPFSLDAEVGGDEKVDVLATGGDVQARYIDEAGVLQIRPELTGVYYFENVEDFFNTCHEQRNVIIQLGDSNQIFGGHGNDDAFPQVFAQKFDIWAAPLYGGAENGGQGAGTGSFTVSVNSGAISGIAALSTTTPEAFHNSHDLREGTASWSPQNMVYGEDNLTYSSNNGFQTLASHPTGSYVVDATQAIGYDIWYGIFPDADYTGAGQITPQVRRGDSPFSTYASSVVSTVSTANAIAKTTLELAPSASRSGLTLGFRWASATTAARGPYAVFYNRATLESIGRGFTYTTLGGFGGESLRDMLNRMQGVEADAENAFPLLFKAALDKTKPGAKLLFVAESGLNDRNETNPSLGPSPVADGDSAEAYLDNFIGIQTVVRNTLSGLVINEGTQNEYTFSLSNLRFMSLPSHPVADPDDAELAAYRTAMIDYAATQNDLCVVNLSEQADYDDYIANSWYQNSVSDLNHLTQAGYFGKYDAMYDAMLPRIANAPPALNDAQDYFMRVEARGGKISTANRALITAFIEELKDEGIWSKIDDLGLYAGLDLDASSFGAILEKIKGTYASRNNAFVFADYNKLTGITPDGSTKFIQTNYFPAATGAMTTTSCHLGIWASNTDPIAGAIDLGCANTDQLFLATNITGLTGGDGPRSHMFNSDPAQGELVVAAPGTYNPGSVISVRASAADHRIFIAGAQVGATQTTTGGALPASQPLYVGGFNNAGTFNQPSSREIAMHHVGISLTPAEVATLAAAKAALIGGLS